MPVSVLYSLVRNGYLDSLCLLCRYHLFGAFALNLVVTCVDYVLQLFRTNRFRHLPLTKQNSLPCYWIQFPINSSQIMCEVLLGISLIQLSEDNTWKMCNNNFSLKVFTTDTVFLVQPALVKCLLTEVWYPLREAWRATQDTNESKNVD